MRGTLQARLQSTVISTSTPGHHIPDFGNGENIWDLSNMEYIDNSELWTVNGGFLMNDVDTARTARQLEDIQPQNSGFTGNVHVLDVQHHLDTSELPAILDMRNIWFTTIQRSEETLSQPVSTSASQSSLSPGGPEIVDEEYRRGLNKVLIYSFPQEDLLPSSGFLVSKLLSKGHNANSPKNLCVRRYFKCFNPVFPIVHAGTFQPTSDNGVLLISMASIGCLFLGSDAAVQRGRRIFETLNKAILTSVGDIALNSGIF